MCIRDRDIIYVLNISFVVELVISDQIDGEIHFPANQIVDLGKIQQIQHGLFRIVKYGALQDHNRIGLFFDPVGYLNIFVDGRICHADHDHIRLILFQFPEHLCFRTEFRLIIPQLYIIIFPEKNCGGVAPVSYTHLDVYKRQIRVCLQFLTKS